HAVVQQDTRALQLTWFEGARRPPERVQHAALHALHAFQATTAQNVGRLARPGRERAGARHHQQRLPQRYTARLSAVVEQRLQRVALGLSQGTARLHEVYELGGEPSKPGQRAADALGQALEL